MGKIRDIIRSVKKDAPRESKIDEIFDKEESKPQSKDKIMNDLIERLGVLSAMALQALIYQYPLRELLNSPGMFFPPDHVALQRSLSLSPATERAILNGLVDRGILKKMVWNKSLLYEIQWGEFMPGLDVPSVEPNKIEEVPS